MLVSGLRRSMVKFEKCSVQPPLGLNAASQHEG
jgi:hypothetical protein